MDAKDRQRIGRKDKMKPEVLKRELCEKINYLFWI